MVLWKLKKQPSIFKYNGTTSFFFFQKYFFQNVFDLKYLYVYLNRAIWIKFFSKFNSFFAVYVNLFSKNFFVDIKKYLFNQSQILASLVYVENAADDTIFNFIFNLRFVSFLMEDSVTNKVLFSILFHSLKNDNISFFFKK